MSMLRQAAGGALSGTAKVLGVASKLLETTARTLRPGGGDTRPQRRPLEQVMAERPSAVLDDDVRGRVRGAEPTPLLDETPHVRTSETHVEDLAAQPATEVIAAVSGLSTDELRLLTEYEMAHKDRRTVLAAIEKALAPGAGETPHDEVILPEAGGVPTSGTIDPSR